MRGSRRRGRAGARSAGSLGGGRPPGRRTLTQGIRRGTRRPRPSGEEGAPLDGRARSAASSAGFGDLADVRIHTDEESAAAASSFGARAFTVGRDIYFGAGQYAPGTPEGDRLLGHELAHAAQQKDAAAGVQAKLEVSPPGDSLEREADRAGRAYRHAARGQEVAPVKLHAAGEQSVAREPIGATSEANAESEGPLGERKVAAAIRFNRRRGHPQELWSQVAGVVGSPEESLGPELVQAVARFQGEQGFDVDGRLTDVTLQRLSQSPGGRGLDRHLRSDAALYVGINPDSRRRELRSLRRNARSASVAGVLGRRPQDTARAGGGTVSLESEEGIEAFLDQLEGLDGARRQAARSFIEEGEELTRDELAQLLTYFHEAETGARIIKRLVLSGHSLGTYLGGKEGQVTFEHLARLKEIFPQATGQVEDLMLSACLSLYRDDYSQYLAIFPNLRTIWGYQGLSPSPATGSLRHMRYWERMTRGQPSRARLKRGQRNVARGEGKRDDNVALWTRDRDGEAHYDVGEPTQYEILRAAIDEARHYYDAAMAGDIDSRALDDLYQQVTSVIRNHSEELGDELKEYRRLQRQILCLRNWQNVTLNFVKRYLDQVQEAYESAGEEMPRLAGMSRQEVLEVIEAFPGDRSSAGYRIMERYLRDLDPAVAGESFQSP